MSVKLFVGSIPLSFNDKNLEETFEKFGTVLYAKVATDNYTGNSRGFGYFEMKKISEAKNAQEALHGKVFKGRNIFVDECRLAVWIKT